MIKYINLAQNAGMAVVDRAPGLKPRFFVSTDIHGNVDIHIPLPRWVSAVVWFFVKRF